MEKKRRTKRFIFTILIINFINETRFIFKISIEKMDFYLNIWIMKYAYLYAHKIYIRSYFLLKAYRVQIQNKNH